MNRWDQPRRYTVEGRGDFPFDMLRRDMAWPASTEDAAKLGQRGLRQIDLIVGEARSVAVKRWDSFGWTIIDGFIDGYPMTLSELEDA